MLVTEVKAEDINRWLELAAEVEPIFQGPMVDSKEFHSYMESKIKKKEALMSLDSNNANAPMGIIGFSRANNRISWFAVFQKYRNRGAGTKLLECVLNRLDRSREISVKTFRESYEPGKPARHVYQKFGFEDYVFGDGSLTHNGNQSLPNSFSYITHLLYMQSRMHKAPDSDILTAETYC